MCFERIGSPARTALSIPVTSRADHDPARSGIFTPESDTTDEGTELAAVEATGVLEAKLIEQLSCVDVRA